MNTPALVDTARALVAGDKGLLAMDESTPTCSRRFARLGIPQTEEARRAYRELLVTTPDLGECTSGAILCDETIRQQEVLAAQRALLFRARCDRAARRGEYSAAMEKTCA